MSPSAHTRFSSSRAVVAAAVVAVALTGSACNEEGSIQVKKIAFEGAHRIDAARLKAAISTKESSWIPWGPKKYFDRSRFDADLKRIQAFYVDRGFPDARVQSVDVQLNDKKNAVSVTVHVSEGEPVIVEDVRFEGLDVLPQWVARRLRRTAPLKAGQPLDRQAFAATRDAAVNEFRDRGYPYATVREPGAAGARRSAAGTRRLSCGARQTHHVRPDRDRRQFHRWRRHHPPAAHVQGGRHLSAFAAAGEPAASVQPRAVRVCERRTAPWRGAAAAAADPRYGGRRQASPPHLRRRLRLRGEGARRRAVAACQLLRRGPHGRHRRPLSSLDRGVKADITQPYFLKPHLSLGFSGQAWNTREPLYSPTRSAGR